MGQRRRGLSMIETLFSLFFITATVLLTAQLMITGSRLQREVEKSLTGAFLADKILARMVASARTSGNAPTASTGQDSQLPEFRYQVEVKQWSLYSPCSARELAQLASDRRYAGNIGHQVKVTVSWSPYLARNRSSAYGVVLSPTPEVDHLVITPDSGNSPPFTKDEVGRFRTEARTASNGLVPGIFFRWYCLPITGNGNIRLLTRDGREGIFTHVYNNPYLATPIYFPAGSQCKVQARARVNGKEIRCDSNPLDLTDL